MTPRPGGRGHGRRMAYLPPVRGFRNGLLDIGLNGQERHRFLSQLVSVVDGRCYVLWRTAGAPRP